MHYYRSPRTKDSPHSARKISHTIRMSVQIKTIVRLVNKVKGLSIQVIPLKLKNLIENHKIVALE